MDLTSAALSRSGTSGGSRRLRGSDRATDHGAALPGRANRHKRGGWRSGRVAVTSDARVYESAAGPRRHRGDRWREPKFPWWGGLPVAAVLSFQALPNYVRGTSHSATPSALLLHAISGANCSPRTQRAERAEHREGPIPPQNSHRWAAPLAPLRGCILAAHTPASRRARATSSP